MDNENVNTQEAVEQTAPAPTDQAPVETQAVDNTAAQVKTDTITGNAEKAPEQAQPAQQQEEVINYDLSDVTCPEGFVFDKEEQDKFVDVVKDMKLSNEDAKKISQYGVDWANRIVSNIKESVVREREAWKEAATKELGADFDTELGHVATAVEYYEKQYPGLRAALDETGAGNRIEILRVLADAGKKLSSDPGMAAGAGAHATGSSQQNAFKSMYPNTNFDKYRT